MELSSISTAALAYLGDAVLELQVREHLLQCGYSSSKSLNAHARAFVSAPAQAAAMEKLHPLLTEEEEAIFRRGRNIGHTNTPKHATVAEYRAATGMETLFGYLHCRGMGERIKEHFLSAYIKEGSNEDQV